MYIEWYIISRVTFCENMNMIKLEEDRDYLLDEIYILVYVSTSEYHAQNSIYMTMKEW